MIIAAGLSAASAQGRGGRGVPTFERPTFERPTFERPEGAGERPEDGIVDPGFGTAGERPERPSREEIAEKIKERLAERGVDSDEIKAKREERKAKAGERRKKLIGDRGDRRAAFRDRLKARRGALKERLEAAKADVPAREE